MSQYTPTTESVRKAYAQLMHGWDEENVRYVEETEAREEFNNWLTEELRKAQEQAWDEAESQDHLQGDWSDELKMTCYDDHNPYRSQP